MSCILSIMLAIVCGYVCMTLAKMCKSNIFIGMILGALFNIFAIIGYVIYFCGINSKN